MQNDNWTKPLLLASAFMSHACGGNLEHHVRDGEDCGDGQSVSSLLLESSRHKSPDEHNIVQQLGAADYPDACLINVGADSTISKSIGKLMFIGGEHRKNRHHAVQLKYLSHGNSMVLCEGDRLIEDFGEQVVSGDCSAALISSPTNRDVLTAAHCLDFATTYQGPKAAAEEARVDFGYTVDVMPGLKFDHADSSIEYVAEYRVQCVAACMQNDRAGVDFAVLRLTEKPKGRDPLVLSSKDVEPGTTVMPYFHPMGLPMKMLNKSVETSKCEAGSYCMAPFDNAPTGSGGALVDAGQLVGIISGKALAPLTGSSCDDTATTACYCWEGAVPESDQTFTSVQEIRSFLERCLCEGPDCPVYKDDCVDTSASCQRLPKCHDQRTQP